MTYSKQVIQAPYLSRYNGFNYYYNQKDDKYQNERFSWLKQQGDYYLYTPEKGDTWDYISYKFYGNPTFYWVILSANRLLDATDPVPMNKEIMVPVLSNLEFM